MIERLLWLSRSVQASETSVADAAGEVTACDDEPAVLSTPAPEGTNRVVQAGGIGGPRVQPSPATRPGRLGKGQKRGQKKEAIVTGLYTIAPYQRTRQEVVAALLREPGRPETSPPPSAGRQGTARHA